MKVGDYLEVIFAQAAALHQNGRFRSTVYGIGQRVYLLNQDRTVLLRFDLPRSKTTFDSPICFSASDYDSREFRCVEDRIEFVQRLEEGTKTFVRTRSCHSPMYTPQQVEAVFDRFDGPGGIPIVLPASIRSLLDDSLSHIEFKARKGQFRILQRDIYAGTLIRVMAEDREEVMIKSDATPRFGPVGMRTDDFMALFTLVNKIEFDFGFKDVVSIRSLDERWPMTGWVSQCIYDELGGEFNGREEQKERTSESEVGRPARPRASLEK